MWSAEAGGFMYTDPAVVRRKVERELKDFVERIDHYRARGIWLLEYKFPELLVAFVATKVKPHAIAPYGVVMDFRNYDVEPPSIRFVNPMTRAPLKKSEIPTRLSRLRLEANAQQAFAAMAGAQPGLPAMQMLGPPGVLQDELLQGWDNEDDRPFVCLQGVLEYHNNPGHTGDPWWLHRGAGAGGIIRLLELLSRYGTEAMHEIEYRMNIQVQGIRNQLTVEQW